MRSPVYRQLGNPQADGKLPTHVDEKLAKSFMEEIACGAYHVAILTSRTEVAPGSNDKKREQIGSVGELAFSSTAIAISLSGVSGFSLPLDWVLLEALEHQNAQLHAAVSIARVATAIAAIAVATAASSGAGRDGQMAKTVTAVTSAATLVAAQCMEPGSIMTSMAVAATLKARVRLLRLSVVLLWQW